MTSFLPTLLRRATLSLLLLSAIAITRAAYDGPVPAPADAFGGPGAYNVITETFPSPGWAGQVVTVLRPEGASGRRPVWFFAHGFGGSDPAYYGELLRHLASHGSIVVFSPYPAALLDVAGNYATLFSGFAAAVDRYASQVDTTRIGFAGHSYGGGAVPALALRAVREKSWGAQGLALLMLAPWYSYSSTNSDLASFPAGTQAVIQVYEDDGMNDHRMAIDVFTHLNLPAADKDYLIVHSDRIDGYNYRASHRVPTGASTPGDDSAFNALDAWGVLRIAQALSASAFDHDATARDVALGDGSAEQTTMGSTASGRALRPMTETDAPVPLFPSSRYLQPFDSALNPRRSQAASLPSAPAKPRLTNLSVRAQSGTDGDVLIAGAALTGTMPKSLLIRAVGPGLAGLGVRDAMADPALVIYRGATPDLSVDDWTNSPEPDALQAATGETGAFRLANGSKDAAILASFAAGALTVHAPAASGSPGVVLIELYDADANTTTTLANLSARAEVGTGDNVLITGFVVSGGSMNLLIRGIGPTLAGFGVSGALRDPVIEVYRGTTRLAANDNWSASPAEAAQLTAAAQKVGAFALPAGSADAAVLVAVPPGAYTAQIRSADGSAGAALAEVYVVP